MDVGASRAFVELSTALIVVLSSVLASSLTRKYIERRLNSYLFWSIGLWLFAISVGEEFLFSAGYYDELLIKSYLGIVALLVECLALGSIQLMKLDRIKNLYKVYAVASALVLVYFLATEEVGNVLESYVVYGALPPGTVIASSLITFPAAAVLVATAALTYKKTRNRKMLSIIAGVVVVSLAGSLYIAQFPALLYYSEFAGVVLLWLGFYEFRSNKKGKELDPSKEGQTDAGSRSPGTFESA